MRAFCVLAALLAALLLAGCASVRPADRAFSYMEEDFSATVTGSVTRFAEDGYKGDASLVGDGLTDVSRSFEATVSVETRMGADGSREAAALTVTYTEPPSLCGVTVSYAADAAEAGQEGKARVTLTRTVPMHATADMGAGVTERVITVDLSATAPAVRDALLAPVGVLLPVGDITAVSAVADGRYTVTRTDGDREAVFTFAKGQTLPAGVTWTTPTRQVEIEVKQS